MQYKTFLSALVVGLAFTGEVAAQRQHRGGGGRGGGFHGTKTSAVATAAASSVASAAAQATDTATPTTNNGGNQGKNNGGNAGDLALDPQAVQSGSDQDGSQASGSKVGQVASATDPANFINFCAGKTLTNGLQVKGGSCNGIVMGDIPSQDNMVSTVITNPANGDDLAPNQTFNFSATSINMVFGHFTNAEATYYSAPQAIDPKTGNIIGHLHFTVQAMPDANSKTPLDPKTFAFFKGVDDAGDGKGDLNAVVTGGLPAGTYRVCTMTSSSNHQPVLMPVAQRGPQDDCIRFTVGQGSGNNGGNDGGAATSATSSAAASATSSAAATATGAAGAGNNGNTGKSVTGNGGKKGKGSKGRGGKGKTTNKGTTTNKGQDTATAAAPKATAATGKNTQSGCDKKGKRAVAVQW